MVKKANQKPQNYDTESAPSDDTLVETVDPISKNNFDKNLENSAITDS